MGFLFSHQPDSTDRSCETFVCLRAVFAIARVNFGMFREIQAFNDWSACMIVKFASPFPFESMSN